MSENIVVKELAECVGNNDPVVLATVINRTGSTPGKPGAMMLVRKEGETIGTIGGGALEHKVTKEALECLHQGLSKEVVFALNQSSELKMSCGGEVRIFLRSFSRLPELIIVGAGHIGIELYRLAIQQGFQVTVIDDRDNLNSASRFPKAKRVVTDSIVTVLEEYPVTTDSYITIATSSHETDKLALAAVVETDAIYKGMIGSRSKVRTSLEYLKKIGVNNELLEQVYAPMGLDIATVKVSEIALSIMSEIMLVKNSGTLNHMKSKV